MTEEEAKEFIGKRVLIEAFVHPWRGFKGTVEKYTIASEINKGALVIKLDDGKECCIFNLDQIKLL